jgi:predicted anti-sigma-YlaC factor YlaD
MITVWHTPPNQEPSTRNAQLAQWTMDCKDIQRKLNRYVDKEVSAGQIVTLEAHVQKCAPCAAEKKELEALSAIIRQIPDIVPTEHSEDLFWERIRQTRKHSFLEKVRSFITQWDIVPFYYPATALLFLGLVIGVASSKVYDLVPVQDRLNPSAVEYLALNRMDTIPYRSLTGVYLSGAALNQDLNGGIE